MRVVAPLAGLLFVTLALVAFQAGEAAIGFCSLCIGIGLTASTERRRFS